MIRQPVVFTVDIMIKEHLQNRCSFILYILCLYYVQQISRHARDDLKHLFVIIYWL